MSSESDKAKSVIENISFMVVATSDGSHPWNSPVYVAFDEHYNFYWNSWVENVHSKNIASNKKVFCIIFDSTVAKGDGEGVYFQGKASAIEELSEISKGLNLICKRKGRASLDVNDFIGDKPRRVYKFVPEKVWVNNREFVDGAKIDNRVEITKDLLS